MVKLSAAAGLPLNNLITGLLGFGLRNSNVFKAHSERRGRRGTQSVFS